MRNRAGQQHAGPVETRTTAELQAIARALQYRLDGDDHHGAELSREITRIERLIARRRSPAERTDRRDAPK